MTPKVFISYSWTSQNHQALVKQWADQLLSDGVEVVLDIYDLKEGNDKYVFMERMVTDETVTHVLVISDKVYSQKADARKAGVGTESQIISREVYEKVDQSKFIPIVCEVDDKGNPFLPTFLKSRIWIDFTSPEAANENWEQLIRVLYGKPFHQKPQVGKAPVYVTEDQNVPSNPALSKYNALKQAILHDKPALSLYRTEFLDACIGFADALRVRKRPDVVLLGEKVLADCGLLRQVRNHIIDWVLLEVTSKPASQFSEVLVEFLERLRELKAGPSELNEWQDSWSEAHNVFVYETFLYIVAGLIKTQAYEVLHEVFTTHYLLPEADRCYSDGLFETFDCFCGNSNALQILAPAGKRLQSPAAELIKRQADRKDIPFSSIIEAELLVFLMVLITPNTRWWYPGTLHYASHRGSFTFFLRATQHKGFKKLSVITGIDNTDMLRSALKEGYERLGIGKWATSHIFMSYPDYMNLNKMDTLK